MPAAVVTSYIDARLWTILETGQDTPPLVLAGKRIKSADAQGWLRASFADQASFPKLIIEVGVRGTHSAYTKDPTLADESPSYLTDAGGVYDKIIERTEQVRITITTRKTDATTTTANVLREAVIDDLMRAGPAMGLVPPFLAAWFTPFQHEQKYLRDGSNPRAGVQTTITFTVTVQQGLRATQSGQE